MLNDLYIVLFWDFYLAVNKLITDMTKAFPFNGGSFELNKIYLKQTRLDCKNQW